jgi:predicted SprT family Zn-dependent metalloprotease
MRFFKQLELLFEGGTRSPSALVKTYAPPARKLTSPSERPIHLSGRDQALESQARELLRSLGANQLAREVHVEWNPRMRTAAGRADYREKLISLNPLLRDHESAHTGNQFKATKLECNKHSSLTSVLLISSVANKLECKMHSSLNGDASETLEDSAPRRPMLRDEIDRTLRHEVAHLLAQWRVGRRRIAPHGEEWRQACRDLGIADEARCHNLPFSTKKYSRRYLYRCPNCKEEFPRVRRIRRAIACLACCRAHNRGEFDPRFRLKLTTKL